MTDTYRNTRTRTTTSKIDQNAPISASHTLCYSTSSGFEIYVNISLTLMRSCLLSYDPTGSYLSPSVSLTAVCVDFVVVEGSGL